MSDMIFIKGLAVFAHHGVSAHENQVGQRFVIDLELTIDLRRAGKNDRLGDTVSYAAVAHEAHRIFTAWRFNLVEAAAESLAQSLLETFPSIEEIRVAVHKPHASISEIFADVGVALTRKREAA
jgi:7,8-dihydroneopterin aldolase/epimerase/oxygenase